MYLLGSILSETDTKGRDCRSREFLFSPEWLRSATCTLSCGCCAPPLIHFVCRS